MSILDKEYRLVLVGPSANFYKGGIAHFTSHLAECLSKYVNTTFVSWRRLYPPGLSKRVFLDSTSKKKVSTLNSLDFLDYLNPFSWIKLVLIVRQVKAETVLLTWIHPVHAPVYFFIIFALRLFANSRIVFIAHNVLPHESFLGASFLTKISFALSDHIVVHSQSEGECLKKLLPSSRVVVSFLPLHDFYRFSDLAVSRQPCREGLSLLFFGNIRPYKGVDILLEALSLLLPQYPNLNLLIAGERFDDSFSAKIDHLIEKHSLHQNVRCDFRYIPNEEISILFEQADVAVFPFRSASQSGSITVSLSFEVPVIATDVGGLADTIEDGVSGYVCKPTPESIAAAIKRFIESPISRKMVGKAAQSLSWDKYIALLPL